MESPLPFLAELPGFHYTLNMLRNLPPISLYSEPVMYSDPFMNLHNVYIIVATETFDTLLRPEQRLSYPCSGE